tara:strand:+ start:86 stop:421 length:336 start_codon:yes stop_codon:yes gene_type:complete
MQDLTTAAEIVKEIGFPILAALLTAFGLYFVLKYIFNQLTNSIAGLSKKIDANQKLHNEKLEAQHKILVALIERLRIVDNDLLRLDTTVKLIHQLEIDLERIGRREHHRKD